MIIRSHLSNIEGYTTELILTIYYFRVIGSEHDVAKRKAIFKKVH